MEVNVVGRRYPDWAAGLNTASTGMVEPHFGQWTTGLGLGAAASITTCNTSWTRISSRLALPCRKR